MPSRGQEVPTQSVSAASAPEFPPSASARFLPPYTCNKILLLIGSDLCGIGKNEEPMTHRSYFLLGYRLLVIPVSPEALACRLRIPY